MTVKDELMGLLRQFTTETDRYVEVASERDSLYRTDLHALSIMIGAAQAGLTVTPGLLREELNLSSPATTALVDRLDSAGHVTRRRSDVDRRQVHLEMTDRARATGAALFAPLARHIDGVFDEYSEEQLALLRDMLQRVTDATVAAKNETAGDAAAS
ncbi:MarR family winged helix-turn-helix transcriptional regulator [uncultured Arthrobacter sp.]|uniref:MarR family winged helix-turn-helix transcriptional regulator n=1 Tax=uncultured Arthrobacter sp. TaxID=114050 RepID=UPI0026288EBB|nr:MarR family transcriptional regulator [uncultured Arthrobacter sp.]